MDYSRIYRKKSGALSVRRCFRESVGYYHITWMPYASMPLPSEVEATST